jgi:hypothetical protein
MLCRLARAYTWAKFPSIRFRLPEALRDLPQRPSSACSYFEELPDCGSLSAKKSLFEGSRSEVSAEFSCLACRRCWLVRNNSAARLDQEYTPVAAVIYAERSG